MVALLFPYGGLSTFISAPERSSLAVMYSSRSRSSERVIFFVWIWNILRRVFSSGRGNSILRSIRPGGGGETQSYDLYVLEGEGKLNLMIYTS